MGLRVDGGQDGQGRVAGGVDRGPDLFVGRHGGVARRGEGGWRWVRERGEGCRVGDVEERSGGGRWEEEEEEEEAGSE